MAGLFLWKPSGQHSGNALVLMNFPTNNSVKNIGVYNSQGQLISNLNRNTTPHTPEAGDQPNPPGFGLAKFDAPQPGYKFGLNATVKVTLADGTVQSYKIPNAINSYTGGFGDTTPGFNQKDSPPPQVAANFANIVQGSAAGQGGAGAIPGSDPSKVPGSGTVNIAGVPNNFNPTQVGFGTAPAYLGGMFPTAAQAAFNPSTAAPYNFTNPLDYAAQFGNFERGQVAQNFRQSEDMALSSLNTELKGLESFVPAATALKQNTISVDNAFNQAQRTRQLQATMPNAISSLKAQNARANTYAQGEVPNSITDRALQLGSDSAAADRSAAGGFGAQSSVARKTADLMSAQQRIQLSQYGDQLLSQNINQEAGLALAPTEYSNAGSQVNAVPSVGTSQLTESNLGALNSIATVPLTQALASTVQQNQYTTSNQQGVNNLNANLGLQANEFNATQLNNFALSQFGYNANYAGAVAGAQQSNVNTQVGLNQQQQFNSIMQQYLSQSQNAGLINSLLSGAGNLVGASGGLGGLLKGFAGLFSGPSSGGISSAAQQAISGGVDSSGVPAFGFGATGSGIGGLGGIAGAGADVLGGSGTGSDYGSLVGGGAGAYFGGAEGAGIGSLIGSTVFDGVEGLF